MSEIYIVYIYQHMPRDTNNVILNLSLFYSAAKCYEDGLGCLKNKSKAVQYYK